MKQYRTILIAILAAASARAAYIDLPTQIMPFGADSVYFQSFDSSRGTLSRVSLYAQANLTRVHSFTLAAGATPGAANTFVDIMAHLYMSGNIDGRPGDGAGGGGDVDFAGGYAPTSLTLSGFSYISRQWSNDLGTFIGPDTWELKLSKNIFYDYFSKPAGADFAGGSFTMSDLRVQSMYEYVPIEPVVTHTPEPATWALVGLGLVGMVAVRRRLSSR